MRTAKNFLTICLAALLALSALLSPAGATRVKDIARLEGPMANPLVGYGLVVGLNGTGDDRKFAPAIRMLSNMLSNLGAGTLPAEVAGSENVAVVAVEATLPPFNRQGDRLDVEVSAVGNAKSLEGGRLVVCPLTAGGAVYAIASGRLQADRRNPTTATIPEGAMVQREVAPELTPGDKLTFKLLPQNADYSVATRIVNAIHQDMDVDPARGDRPVARAVDAATIEVELSEKQLENPVPFISRLERLNVPGLSHDMEARVVIDEGDGSFYAINGNVEISPVVVGWNGIQVKIQPSSGQETTTLDDLVSALRQIGASAPDVIGILESLETAGALHAKVIRK